jgi:hypothetical protein
MFETNAIIEGAQITNDDHGLLSAWLMLKYDGSGQGFGGYVLYLPHGFEHHNDAHKDCCGIFIWRCMQIAEVTEWSKMVGKAIRVRKDSEFGDIQAIGHIIKNDWFCPKIEFGEDKKESE